MLQAFLEFCLTLGDMALVVLEYLRTLIADSIYVLTGVVHVALQIPDAFGWLPVAMLNLLTVLFTVVVIYKFLGRE